MPARHNLAHETELWDAYAESVTKDITEPVLNWTQYAGHGPGPELLGDPKTALEIGCGTGRAAVHLASRGVEVTGLDLSPVMVKQITAHWAGRRVPEFVCGEVLDYLTGTGRTWESVYSIFGAGWFTDPVKLLPLVAQRLAPGGVFAFSQPPPIPGAYGPQGMYKGGFAGKALYTYRYSYTPRKWRILLERAGFTDITVDVLQAPKRDHIGTLIARAALAP
ncbi:class I SAM-dependent methyltransferase [Streptomyces sp. MAR4 CNX-425]|uniref:class I SAM-dependent methyltransferase n=1 Tax=Streptomyces sp. MAR4 CNX-425 TaxID=3406343 RepID=UPI003B50C9B5